MSQDTATNMMRVADKFRNLRNIDLKPSILYTLAAPSTPEQVIEQAIEKAESGEKVTPFYGLVKFKWTALCAILGIRVPWRKLEVIHRVDAPRMKEWVTMTPVRLCG